jgi:hypothetical protein
MEMSGYAWLLVICAGLIAIVMAAGVIRGVSGDRGGTKEQISARRFEIIHRATGGRIILAVCFWLWGIGYGAYCIAAVVGAEAQYSLGMGTSAAVTTRLAFWIGGLVLFGVGALLAGNTSVMRIIDPAPPEG